MSQAPLLNTIYSDEDSQAILATCGRGSYDSAPDSAGLSFNFGNGLVEIAALTSLVGSATTEKLVLGNKGAAGIVWATMTIFGGMSIVKSGLATVTPSRFRDSLSVRSREGDETVGLSMSLDSKGAKHSDIAKGIGCEIRNKIDPILIGRRDIHVFNRRVANVLDSFDACQLGDDLKVHSYVQNAYHEESSRRHARNEILYIAASVVKLIEVGSLWQSGAVLLAVVALLTWLFFLVFASILVAYGYSLERSGSTFASEVDIIAGILPTPTKVGGSHKVILGIPGNPKEHFIWKLFWSLSSLVMVVSVMANYVALGQSPDLQVFSIWTGFQVLWLAFRTVFYHVVEDQERPYSLNLQGMPWSKVGFQQRTRVRYLAFALAKYLREISPRGSWSYTEEVDFLQNMDNLQMEYFLPSTPSGASIPITVRGVIGDPTLLSVSWLFGSKKGGFDLYDACIVLLSLKESTVAIPAVRALSGWRPTPVVDTESGITPERPPRGSRNEGFGIEWWYWVPCVDGHWLYFRSEDTKIKGPRTAEILTDAQITERLLRGDLFISMQDVSEIKNTLDNSRKASAYLLELIG